ncbi:Fic family protein [Dyadobacter sp. 50-39]|uniref:Fic/DOC family protein n=1 Tax=Dyadobacter sp. 50-39 TaxID=1895756 RepID=UPI0009629795|nr:Fic family protein [Dyadobacter sp. 50-39]OJV22445.1 MAG: cell filamentation protein Fic [Dyadobacter sp. 50-39]
MKYNTPDDENQILPNLLDLKSQKEIGLSEFEGFVTAEILLAESLSAGTKFNIEYILKIHHYALKHLYSFAGKYREVNISKGGFAFPAARFLPQSMKHFESDILSKLPKRYSDQESLIKDVAKVHAELLFIHPFREGNGRTARILANQMLRKAGYASLKFELIENEKRDFYIFCVQAAANQDYTGMESLIRSIFPD